MRRLTCCLVIVAMSCGPKPAARPPAPRFDDPASTLLAQEQDVWTLEGRLLVEADAALRGDDARAALGDPTALLRAADAEAKVRAFLREHRSEDLRAVATTFLGALDAPTRQVLDGVAANSHLGAADVFMDYLTHEAVYDLSIMRLGFRRWRAGRLAARADAQALATSFFADTGDAPSAARGIRVVERDETSIVIDVFGGRVREEVARVEVEDSVAHGRVAQLDWRSNYEQLRRMSRGEPRQATYREALAWDDEAERYRVSYAAELDEYLTWNAQNPWAELLYALSIDDVADLFAGAAAAGGLEVGSAAVAADAADLPERGVIGTIEHGVSAEVVAARFTPSLGGLRPRRGQFVVVTVAVRATLDEPLRAPSTWFTLAAGDAEFPELGVTRPGLAAALMTMTPSGARMLALPFTSIGADTSTLVLVYDVPSDVDVAALVLGADELALRVAPARAEPPAATVIAEDVKVDAVAPAGGVLAWIAEPGARVVAGAVVAKLDGHRAAEKALRSAARKLAAYERKLAAYDGAPTDARAARRVAALRGKLAEKRALVAERAARLRALEIAAPVDGAVEAVGKVGAALRAGTVVARVVSSRRVARFVLRDTRSGLAPGGGCRVAARSASSREEYGCAIVDVTGLRVEIRLAADAPFQPGDEIVLSSEGT